MDHKNQSKKTSSNNNKQTEDEANDSKQIRTHVKQQIDRLLRGKLYELHKSAHEVLPNLNASQFETEISLIKKAAVWKVSLPTPVFLSPHGFIDSDPCHRRTSEYRTYVNRLRMLPSTYRGYQRKKLYRNARKRGIYPFSVMYFAELLERNPDEFFSGRHDWFYTGGNLETFCYNDKNYIAHATGKKLENIDISRCEHIANYTKLVHVLSKKSQVIINNNKDVEILEIQHLNESNLLVRRRNYISLYTYSDAGLKYRYHLHSNTVPFISSTIESLSSPNILTSDLNKTVALWDLNVSAQSPKTILFNSQNTAKDKNWNCLRYIDENSYIFADLCKFYFLDSRQSILENATSYGLYESYEPCEVNSSVCVSNFNNLIYFASSHKLLAVDKRFVGKDVHDKRYIVLRWAHQMLSFPLILRTTMRDGVELIGMASPKNGDIRFCENNRICINESGNGANIVYHSPSLPVKPPSIVDAYRLARLEGFCLNPYTTMSERLRYSHTGMVFLKENENQLILTGNSNGDILLQQIVDESEEELFNEDNLAAMNHWEMALKDIDSKNQTPINITGVKNLYSLKRVFQSVQLDSAAQNEDDQLPIRQQRPGRWQRSIKTLQRFKDALAGDILSVWDIEPNDDANRSKIVLPQSEEVGEEMINKWLNNAEEVVVDESALSSTGINIFDIPAVDTDTLNQTLNTTTASKSKQPVKRKYVKGF